MKRQNIASHRTPGRWLPLGLLTIAATAAIYSRTTMGPLQESIRIALKLSDNQIALLQGPALAVPLAMMAVPLGLAIDRFSRVRLIFAFAILNLLATLLTALAANFAMLFAARCVIGVSGMSTFITAVSLLADIYGSAQRGRAMMVITIGGVVGMAAAFALGGSVLSNYGSAPEGWRFAMSWLSVPLLPVIVVTLLLQEPQRTGQIVEKPPMKVVYRELWKYRRMILPLIVGTSVVLLADGAASIWMAPTLAREFQLAPNVVGSIMAIALTASGVLGPIAGGVLADFGQQSGGPRRTMIFLASAAFLSVPASLFALAPTVGLASLLFTIFITVGAGFNVTVSALGTIVIPNELRGTCMSLMSGAAMLAAYGLAPVAVSVLSGSLGGPATIGKALAIVCVVTTIGGGFMFAGAARYFPRNVVFEQ